MKIENIENGIEFPPFNIPLKQYLVDDARAVVIVVPAMGTASSFYQPFSEELVAHGFTALLAELPGTGTSGPRPSWTVNYGYRDLVESYLPELVRLAREIGQGAPVVLIGHSLGAHAGTLAVLTGSIDIDAVVTLAGGNIHYRNWEGAAAVKVFLAATLFSSLSGLFGHLPGQYLGFGGPQARTLIREWSKIIFTGRFSHIYDRMMADSHVPALCIGFQGDELAPEKSVAGLAQVLNGEAEFLPVNWPGNPHSAWARSPIETVTKTIEWLVRRDVVVPV
jgi:predicted alpha/beta hydrolase